MKSYTFHVYLPDYPQTWRKIEMSSDQTLHELHLAILDAFGFDHEHPYSFFMSGEAWDEDSEYTLPHYREYGFLEEEEESAVAIAEEVQEEVVEEGLEPIGIEWRYDDELENYEIDEEMPNFLNTDELETFWQSLQESDEEQLKELSKLLTFEVEQEEITNEFLNTLKNLNKEDFVKFVKIISSEQFIDAIFNNTETVTLGDIKLRKNQEFLYLYDYDNPWQFRVKVDKIDKKAKPGEYPRLVESVGEAPAQYADRNV